MAINFRNLFLRLLAIWLLIGAASAAVDLSLSVSIEPEEIEAGTRFDVVINVTNEDEVSLDSSDELLVSIYFDGVLVHESDEGAYIPPNSTKTIIISSSEFTTDEGNIWEKSLAGYMCGDFDVKVKIGGDVSTKKAEETLEINGEKIYVDMEPEEPTASDKINVTVEDSNGNKLDNMYVRITQLSDDKWSIDDPSKETRTKKGIANFDALEAYTVFKDEIYSNYQLDVWRTGYCLHTETFSVKNSLKITNVPSGVYAGDEIRVRVVDNLNKGVADAIVTVSGTGGTVGSYTTDGGGYASFSIKNGGKYSLIASKPKYESSSAVSLTVLSKGSIELKIEPEKQAVGKEVTIAVTSKGDPVGGAEIRVEKPDGTRETLYTSTAGKVTYTPNTRGTYKITALKEGYNEAYSSFTASNFFYVTMPKNPMIGDSIAVVVRNQNNESVGGAMVNIKDSTISGLTDSSGVFSFVIDSAGKYILSIKKEDFTEYNQEVIVYGVLDLKAEPEKINLGESLTLTVSDHKGSMVEANIDIIKPDGIRDRLTKSSYTFTPQMAGEYIVNASKNYYLPASVTIVVRPYPLNLDVWLNGKDLMIKATKGNTPIANISISVTTPSGKEIILKTNKDGISKIDLKQLNETGVFTVSSADRNYDKKTVTKEIKSLGTNILPIIFIGIVMLMMLVFIVFIVFFISHRKSKSGVWGPKRKRGGGIGLGSI